MRAVGLLAICLVWASAGSHADTVAPSSGAPEDADPQHLWNRLNDALFVRTAPDNGERFGSTELDILFWSSTQHLLTGPSHEKALRVLDEFIRDHGERSIRDPVKRAFLQRDLWALFDWSAARLSRSDSSGATSQAAAELQRRLVTVIRRVALSADEITRLPDNSLEAASRLEGSGFPQGLFASDGGWLLVGRADDTTAPEHTAAFGGRSVFLVFVKFPGGREQALRYLQALREFVPARIYFNESAGGVRMPGRPRLTTNPATPQFPVDTQWALVRRLNLIDDQGEIRATPLIESIQTRRYASIPDADGNFDAFRNAQVVAELTLDREHLPALRVVEQGERDFQFVHFRSLGGDPFEQRTAAGWASSRDELRGETLRTCRICHQARGILSVNTYAAFRQEAHALDGSTQDREVSATFMWKSRQFDWGLLKGLWRQ
jgi:hypothetical protein